MKHSSLTRSYRLKWEEQSDQFENDNILKEKVNMVPYMDHKEHKDKAKSITESMHSVKKNELYHQKSSKDSLELLLGKGDGFNKNQFVQNGHQQITSFIPTR
mmetsp:Transcript_16966/g.16195  ORF Transcript_16966/g.16195 Transcript_16966/m.16195 type:complete len:102 (+) Transcript_16966:307-612(+)|eukprot:CAMPEP_0170550678 /NCGR_PEP_ID=MMETSP0211-20121228/8690_1 /TAXON_ID=311385 /ORGANISM="Pseudokeronopsis sp., Strain OXSARD2" /LENGTH=101 /DNA_ID=CAMNT_0010857331 /DNA_START=787 /DNA_END=1092 /DNA_ORIENTATION=+